MANDSKIEWTNATWNPVVGCTRVHAGCDHCYAVTQSHRMSLMGKAKYDGLTVLNQRGERHFNGVVRTVPEDLEIPLRWRRPRLVFVNSMSDLFHHEVPVNFIDRVWAVMAMAKHHTFQILTKRPLRMANYLLDLSITRLASEVRQLRDQRRRRRPGEDYVPSVEEIVEPFRQYSFLPNVWVGASVSDQATKDKFVQYFWVPNHHSAIKDGIPAAVRFLSIEPMLGPIDTTWMSVFDWVIIGGESGPHSRPCAIEWIRELVGGFGGFQGRGATSPSPFSPAIFVKQLGRYVTVGNLLVAMKHPKGGDMAEWPEDLRIREWPRTRGRPYGAALSGTA